MSLQIKTCRRICHKSMRWGTLNIAGIAGLNAALGWLAQITIDAIREKESENRRRLIELLSRYSFIKIIGNYDSCSYVWNCLLRH